MEDTFSTILSVSAIHQNASVIGYISLFKIWCWNKWIFTYERMNLDPYFTIHTNINPKWIKYLDIRHGNIKLFGENVGKSFMVMVLAVTSSIWAQKHKKEKQKSGTMSNKNLLHSKEYKWQSGKTTSRMGKFFRLYT